MIYQTLAADVDSRAANRAGQLTPEQQRQLAKIVHSENMNGLVAAGLFAFLILLILLAGSQGGSSQLRPRDYLFFGGLLIASLMGMTFFIVRRARMLAEVQAGRLERTAGHVEWKSGRYRAAVPGRSLDLRAFNLAIGTYDFSFLPRSGRVVAAELAAADTPDKAKAELCHALAVTNQFNVDDLPTFRQGRLGASTFRLLRRTWSIAGWLALAAVILLVIFVYLVNADVSQDLVPVMFMFAIFLGIAALASGLADIVSTLDVLRGKVASAEGMIVKTKRQTYGRGAHTYFYYVLDNQRWLVTPEAYRALLEGPKYAYRVFFLPRSKRLVGIEPLE